MGSVTVNITTPDCTCCSPCAAGKTLKCRTRGGTASLCGYSEYVSPSCPPKKYRTRTLSGVREFTEWASGGCVGSVICADTQTYSGTCTYDASTCNFTQSGVDTRTGCTPSTNSLCTIIETGVPFETTNYTQTSASISNTGTCFNGGPSSRSTQSTAKEVLTVEDLESDALSRLLAGSGGTWSGWFTVGGGCSLPGCCEAGYQSRDCTPTNFSFNYTECEWEIDGSGLTPGKSYSVPVNYYRSVYGAGSFTLFATDHILVTADGSGNITATGTVPNDKGFQTYADLGACS